jgi:hypothetical protein
MAARTRADDIDARTRSLRALVGQGLAAAATRGPAG